MVSANAAPAGSRGGQHTETHSPEGAVYVSVQADSAAEGAQVANSIWHPGYLRDLHLPSQGPCLL